MSTFTVRLMDAVGRTLDLRVKARSEYAACGVAVRRATKDTGRTWYACYAL